MSVDKFIEVNLKTILLLNLSTILNISLSFCALDFTQIVLLQFIRRFYDLRLVVQNLSSCSEICPFINVCVCVCVFRVRVARAGGPAERRGVRHAARGVAAARGHPAVAARRPRHGPGARRLRPIYTCVYNVTTGTGTLSGTSLDDCYVKQSVPIPVPLCYPVKSLQKTVCNSDVTNVNFRTFANANAYIHF